MWVYRHWTQWKCHANPWFTLIVFILTNSHNNCSSSNKSVFKLWINVYQMVCLYVSGMNANWNDYVIGIRLWWPTVKRTLSLRLSSMLIKWFMANLYVCVWFAHSHYLVNVCRPLIQYIETSHINIERYIDTIWLLGLEFIVSSLFIFVSKCVLWKHVAWNGFRFVYPFTSRNCRFFYCNSRPFPTDDIIQ